MNKKKKIKRLERENANLRERLKFIEGYFTASNVVIKAFEGNKSTAESLTNAFRKEVEINETDARKRGYISDEQRKVDTNEHI